MVICCRGKGFYIVAILNETIEDCIRRRVKKYDSDLRVIATYLVKGYDGVGGVLIYKELQKRHPEEYKELEEIARKSLLAAEEPEVYHLIPKGYTLDRSDPDVLVLRREDRRKTFVAVFSPTGATPQGILDAVKEDRERRGC